MTAALRNRLVMASLGAIGAICFFVLKEVIADDLFSRRMAVALGFFILTAFGGAMSMASGVQWRKLWPVVAVHGAVVAVLVSVAGFRFDPIGTFEGDLVSIFAVLFLGLLPLPFIMAHFSAQWRDYQAVFTHAWGLFLRLTFAWLFTGLVWGLIFLSDALFDLVGLRMLDALEDIEISLWIITGLVFGLAVALVDELSDYVSPYLILQVMRLLVPVVLVVLVVFLIALPFQGIDNLFGDLSSAGILLTMAAAAISLVTAAADQTDEESTLSGVMLWASKGLGVLAVVPAVLGTWAIATRVWQYGWTPERLFGAWAAVFIMCYALAYTGAALRGAWRDQVRRANLHLALGIIATSALWLTPVLSPQAISAQSQISLFKASGMKQNALDLYALQQWGVAGKSALAQLTELAKTPGQEALAAALKEQITPSGPPDAEALRLSLANIMPLQPKTPASIAAQAVIFAAADAYLLQQWQISCESLLPGGQPGCAMVVAELRTDRPGDEVLVAEGSYDQYVSINNVFIRDGYLQQMQLVGQNGQYPDLDQSIPILLQMQTEPPVIAASPFNMLSLGPLNMMLSPY